MDYLTLRGNVAAIIAVIDEHDAGILDNEYICPCKFRGTEAQWHDHIADLIAARLGITEFVKEGLL